MIMIKTKTYTIELTSSFILTVPTDTKILSVQVVRNQPKIQISFDINKDTVEREFAVYPTVITDTNARHMECISTFVVNDAKYTLFELLK